VVDVLLTSCQQILPVTEAQARHLVGVPKEQISAVWEAAVAERKGKKVTAEAVRKAKEEIVLKKTEPPIESWRADCLSVLGRLKNAVKKGSRQEAQVLIGRLNLLINVGTYGQKAQIPEDRESITQS
jgi:hypothetical protein